MQNWPSPVQQPSSREGSSEVSSGTAELGALDTSTASSFAATCEEEETAIPTTKAKLRATPETSFRSICGSLG
ncbi:hypothetical protein KH5H1_54720 [Corallococcus caeni]|nr:hypothetical protein KH5H1_54720 [Corallococcus sp. KH5-1]